MSFEAPYNDIVNLAEFEDRSAVDPCEVILQAKLSCGMADLEDRLRLRSEECDLLRVDLRASTEELVGLQGQLREYREKIGSLTSEIIPLRHALDTSEKKRQLLETQVDTVQKNLMDKKTELNVISQDYSEKSSNMEIKLRGVTADLEASKNKRENLQDIVDTQTERIEEFIRTVSNLEASNLKRTAELEQTIDEKCSTAQRFKHLYEDAMMKIEALEEGNASLKEDALSYEDRMREFEASLEASRSTAQETMGKLSSDNDKLLKRIKKLEEEKAELQLVPMGSAESSLSRFRNGVSVVDSIVEEGVFDAHELYEHLSKAQAELISEKNKRKEAEQYLRRIHKDIELKGPMIAKMKSDHSLLLYERDALSRQLESVLKENSLLRDYISTVEDGAGMSEGKYSAVRAIYDQNKDLAAQITALLARSQGEPAPAPAPVDDPSAANVISTHLVPFESVQQLQQRNMQLLQVVRRLASEDSKIIGENDALRAAESISPLAPLPDSSVEISPSTGGLAVSISGSGLSRTLSDALEELHKMRESRAKAEVVLLDVMRERDELKSIINPALGKDSDIGRKAHGESGTTNRTGINPAGSPPGSPGKDGGKDQSMLLEKATAPLQTLISQLEGRLTSAMRRIEECQKERTSISENSEATIGLLRQEANTAKQSLSVAEGKIHLLTEKQTRLHEEIVQLKGNFAASSASLLATERKLDEECRAHIFTQSKLKSKSDESSGLEDTLKFLRLELELAQAAEANALKQLSASEEARRQESTLLDSMQSIEKDLTSKSEGELQKALSERDALNKELAKVRKDLLDTEMSAASRLSGLEEELKRVSVTAEGKIEEATQLRLSCTKHEAQARAATDRLVLMEKQLEVVQDRMLALQGAEKIEEVLAREGKTLEKERDDALRKLEQAQTQLNETRNHMEYFRKIGLATDEKMKAMLAVHEEQTDTQRKALEEGDALVQKLRAQIQELNASRDSFAAQKAAFAEYEKEQEVLIKSRQEETAREASKVKEEVSLGKQREESLKVQISHLQQLADTLRADLESSNKANAVLKADKEKESARAGQLTRSLQLSEESVADLTASAVSADLQHKEELSLQEELVSKLKEQEQGLRRTNDLLHAQLQTLGARIGRYEASDGWSARLPVSDGQKEELDDGPEGEDSASNALANVATAAEGDVQEELVESRRANEELRELVWLLKRERDALEARVSSADRENVRASAALNGMQKSLEEARTQLRRETERRAPTRAEADFQKLISEVAQLNSMQEQLAEVKRENQRLTHTNSSQFAELSTLRAELSSTSSPKDAQISKLLATKTALETRIEGLQGEKTLWTQRLHQLFERYKDIDPEEFSRLQARIEELTQEKEIQKQQIAAATQVKESVEKASESLRNKMRQLKAQAQEQLKKAQETHAEEVARLEAKLADQIAKTAAAVATSTSTSESAVAVESSILQASASVATTDFVATAKSAEEQIGSIETNGKPSGTKTEPAAAVAAVAAASSGAMTDSKSQDDELQRMKSILKRNRSERSASIDKDKDKDKDKDPSLECQPSEEKRPSKRPKREDGSDVEGSANTEGAGKESVEEGISASEGDVVQGENNRETKETDNESTANTSSRGMDDDKDAHQIVDAGSEAPKTGAPSSGEIKAVTSLEVSTADGVSMSSNPFAQLSSANTLKTPNPNPFVAVGGGALSSGSMFGTFNNSSDVGTSGSSSKLNAAAAPFTFKPSGSNAGPGSESANSSSSLTFAPGTSIFGNKPSNNQSSAFGSSFSSSSAPLGTKPVIPSLLSGVSGKSSESEKAGAKSLSSMTSPFFSAFASKAPEDTNGSNSQGGSAQQQSLSSGNGQEGPDGEEGEELLERLEGDIEEELNEDKAYDAADSVETGEDS